MEAPVFIIMSIYDIVVVCSYPTLWLCAYGLVTRCYNHRKFSIHYTHGVYYLLVLSTLTLTAFGWCLHSRCTSFHPRFVPKTKKRRSLPSYRTDNDYEDGKKWYTHILPTYHSTVMVEHRTLPFALHPVIAKISGYVWGQNCMPWPQWVVGVALDAPPCFQGLRIEFVKARFQIAFTKCSAAVT